MNTLVAISETFLLSSTSCSKVSSASFAWISGLVYHFRNSMTLALLGADFGTPAMKMPTKAKKIQTRLRTFALTKRV